MNSQPHLNLNRTKTINPKVSQLPKLKLAKSQKIIRERLSPKNPPYINSKIRISELSLEKSLQESLNKKNYPALGYINYKSWSNRNQTQKTTYLDNIYIKQLAKMYENTNISAIEQNSTLRNLAKSIKKQLKATSQTEEIFITNKKVVITPTKPAEFC